MTIVCREIFMIAASSVDAMCELTDGPTNVFRGSSEWGMVYLSYHVGCIFLVFDLSLTG